MKPGKLNPDYLRALMEGTQTLHEDGERRLVRIDEIMIDGNSLELRWDGKVVMTYDLAEILAESRRGLQPARCSCTVGGVVLSCAT